MNMQEVDERLEKIRALIEAGDHEAARHEEDQLLIDALKDVAACSFVSYEALGDLTAAAERARKTLELTNIDYQRWCA